MKQPNNPNKKNAPSNKAIVKYVNDKTGIGIRECRDVLRGIFHYISEQMEAGQVVNVHGFGKFILKTRKGRTAHYKGHPVLGDRTIVQAESRYIRFIASNLLKKQLNPKK